MKTSHGLLNRAVATAAFAVACLMSAMASADIIGLRSEEFGRLFLRLDGHGVTSFLPDGGGVVNSQYGCGPWERFNEVPVGNGKIALESVAFPNVFLRLDGRGVSEFLANGGGVVNAQFGHFAWEEFWPRSQGVSSFGSNDFAYESVAFPNVFLRLDGRGVTGFLAPGGGTANAQFGHYGWEVFARVPFC